jgi:hypothetical protein
MFKGSKERMEALNVPQRTLNKKLFNGSKREWTLKNVSRAL